jgi:hypothetical protein
MTLFASAANGLAKESYGARADTYNMLIGSLDALEIQAKARPVPKTKNIVAVNTWLEKRGLPAVTDDEVPSATAIGKISATLKKCAIPITSKAFPRLKCKPSETR